MNFILAKRIKTVIADWVNEKELRGKKATAQQRRASDPMRSVWVEASAGTGKTKVLSDRVLRLLLDGVSPAKILCLTYTKAAAVEMNNRIAQKLSDWAVATDEDLDKQLESLLGSLPEHQSDYVRLISMARRLFAVLLDTPGGMKIQTLHSFCQEVLKRFPLEAKIPPYFEVIDDRVRNEILNELKKKMLSHFEDSKCTPIGEAIGYLTSRISESSFPEMMSSLTDNAGKIIRLFQRYVSLDELLKDLAGRLGVFPNDTEERLKLDWLSQQDVSVLKCMNDAWQQGSSSDLKKAEALSPLLERPFVLADYDVFNQQFLNKDGTLCASYATKKVLSIYPDLADESLKIGQSLQILEKKMAALRVYASTKAIIILAKELIDSYQCYKFENAKMDYDDLILITRRLLEDKSVSDWVLFKLDGGIDHLLIDEAQDTSPDQWAIIRSLTQEFFSEENEKRTVFVVGDRKQSIYSFQGADPREFENMRQYFMAKSSAFDEVNLDISFRSTAAILDTVNAIFADKIAKEGVLPENLEMQHIPFRYGEGGKVELWPLLEPEADENPDVWLPPVERKTANTTSSRLAKMIAYKIKNLVGKEILSSQGRPLRYSDFLILVQRRNVFVDELVRECKQAGVSVAGVDKIKLSSQAAIQDLIALGNFLLLPTDDLTLAVVLKSPLFGLQDKDLEVLCIDRGNASLWSRLGDNPVYALPYQILLELLNRVDFSRPFELYSYVLNVLHGRQKFEERMGSEVIDGLDEFINLTLSFEQEHIPTLQTFINWISEDEAEIKREQEQGNIDAVRIMTVHGSKGLQAPFVILPDTVRQINCKKEMGMLWDDLFYYPLSSSDYEDHCSYLKEQEQEAQAEEYRRLLYVALTRAEDRLCLCGYAQKNKPRENCWYDLCSRGLKKIGYLNDETLIYETRQQIEPKAVSHSEGKETNCELPPMWLKEIPLPETPLAKPYTPSKPDEIDEEDALFSPLLQVEDNRYRRGLIIHKLLQFLPDALTEDKKSVIREFLRQNASEFTKKQQEKIVEEVYALVSDSSFAPLFGDKSRAEVPIMGEVDGKIISAQIDRLAFVGDEVWIVDFKTNRPAARTIKEVQNVYIKQLTVYRSLLERIYPRKSVKTFILWTDTAQIMQIDA